MEVDFWHQFHKYTGSTPGSVAGVSFQNGLEKIEFREKNMFHLSKIISLRFDGRLTDIEQIPLAISVQ